MFPFGRARGQPAPRYAGVMLELIDGREQLTPVHIVRPRPASTGLDPHHAVSEIVEDVRLRGDDALIEHTQRLDGVRLTPDRLQGAARYFQQTSRRMGRP